MVIIIDSLSAAASLMYTLYGISGLGSSLMKYFSAPAMVIMSWSAKLIGRPVNTRCMKV